MLIDLSLTCRHHVTQPACRQQQPRRCSMLQPITVSVTQLTRRYFCSSQRHSNHLQRACHIGRWYLSMQALAHVTYLRSFVLLHCLRCCRVLAVVVVAVDSVVVRETACCSNLSVVDCLQHWHSHLCRPSLLMFVRLLCSGRGGRGGFGRGGAASSE